MLSSSPIRPSVPSVSALRFLRAQSNSFHSVIPSTCARTSEGGTHRWPSFRRNASGWAHVDPSPSRATPKADLFTKPALSPKRSGSRRRPSIGLNAHANLYLSPSSSVHSRSSASSSRPLLRRLFDLRRKKTAESKLNRSQGPALLDDKSEPNFTVARNLAAKASNELRLRCTEFDSNGNVTLVNGEFKKSELIAKVSVNQVEGFI